MPKTQNGAISFGLVHIPIELYSAVQDSDVHFNQLVVGETGELSRVRYKKVCAATGREVKPEEIKKGYEYDKGSYVLVEDAEIEALKSEKDRNIVVTQFADIAAIPPILFNKPYLLVPQKGGEKAFELLRQAMIAEGQVAIARTVIGATARHVVIMPRHDGLILVTLFFERDVKPWPKAIAPVSLSDEELAMARQLVGMLQKDFDPSGFDDEYQAKLREHIRAKVEAKEGKNAAPEQGNSVVDLMEALKASLEKRTKKAPLISKPKAKKAKLPSAA